MNQAILNASVVAGRTAVDVTAAMTGLFGAIPSECVTVTVTEPAVPVRLNIVTQPQDSFQCPSSGNTITVSALDQNNNNIAVSGFVVELAIGTNPSSGVLGGVISGVTDNGLVSFNDWCISQPGDGYTLNVTSTGLVGVSTSEMNITDAQVEYGLSITEYPVSLNTNTIGGNIVVNVLDSIGQLVGDSTVEVTLSLADPGTAVLSGTLVKNAVAGVVVFNDVKINKRGTSYRFIAESSGLVDGQSGFVAVNRDFASGQQPVSYRSTVVSGIRTRR
jgi:hypothetical protein